MRCANPECGIVAHDLAAGVLRLIEFELPPEKRVTRSEWGFPICSVPSRYFWLCERCSEVLRIRRWTEGGLVFEQRITGDAVQQIVKELKVPAMRAPHCPRLLIRRRA